MHIRWLPDKLSDNVRKADVGLRCMKMHISRVLAHSDKQTAPSHAVAHSQTCILPPDRVCPRQIEGDSAAQEVR